MSKLTYLLDAGHGGIINGIYVTNGKRGIFNNYTIYEGVINRVIRNLIARKLDLLNIDYHFVTVGQKDVPLGERVKIVNALTDAYNSKTFLMSIHLNGFSKESAKGWEVWTSRGETKSDEYATILYEEMRKVLKYESTRFRKDTKDGDVDKEANHYITKYSKCPAILSENLFMTNKVESKFLLSRKGQDMIAQAHVNTILRIEKLN